MLAFDTLQFSQDLQDVFTPKQAEALAKAMSRHVGEDLVTKTDLTHLQDRLDLKLQNLETSLSQQIKDKVAEAKLDLIKWMVGTLIVNLLSVAGLMITLIKIVQNSSAGSAR